MVSDEGALCTTRATTRQRTMGEHATTTTNEKTDKANASTSVLKQKYQALLESRNKVRRGRCV